jgi:hypothetical protein
MRRIVLTLLAFAPLSTGCVNVRIIPDPTIPHQVAAESEVTIWARGPDGKKAKQRVRLLEGWWIAGPPVVEAE